MLEAGVFDDVAATVMLHPGPIDITAARSLALSDIAVTLHRPRIARGRRTVFRRQRRRRRDRRTGRHRPAAPTPLAGTEDARHRDQRRHRPQRRSRAAELLYYLRAETKWESLRELESRMTGCFAAGRSPPAATRRLRTCAAYDGTGARPVAGRDATRRDVRHGTLARACRVEAAPPLGSTDMGNVTQLMPGIHPVIGIDAGARPPISRRSPPRQASPVADTAVIDGAIVLARTVVALADGRQAGPGVGGRSRAP